jgi:hypothetical protein
LQQLAQSQRALGEWGLDRESRIVFIEHAESNSSMLGIPPARGCIGNPGVCFNEPDADGNELYEDCGPDTPF